MFFFSIHNEWQGDAEIPAETICNSTGWGLTSGGGLFPPNALQWVQIPVHSHEKCQETFTGIEITQGMICAGGPGASACNVSIVNKQLTKVLRAKSCNTNIPIPTYIVLLLFIFFKGWFWWTTCLPWCYRKRKISWNCLIWTSRMYRCNGLYKSVPLWRLDCWKISTVIVLDRTKIYILKHWYNKQVRQTLFVHYIE